MHSGFLQLPELTFCPVLKAAVEREYENLTTADSSAASSSAEAAKSLSVVSIKQSINFDCFVGILQKFSKEESSESKLECT